MVRIAVECLGNLFSSVHSVLETSPIYSPSSWLNDTQATLIKGRAPCCGSGRVEESVTIQCVQESSTNTSLAKASLSVAHMVSPLISVCPQCRPAGVPGKEGNCMMPAAGGCPGHTKGEGRF